MGRVGGWESKVIVYVRDASLQFCFGEFAAAVFTHKTHAYLTELGCVNTRFGDFPCNTSKTLISDARVCCRCGTNIDTCPNTELYNMTQNRPSAHEADSIRYELVQGNVGSYVHERRTFQIILFDTRGCAMMLTHRSTAYVQLGRL